MSGTSTAGSSSTSDIARADEIHSGFHGTTLIWLFINLPLLGISLFQAYLYFPAKDSKRVQLMVATVITLGAVHSAMACFTSYHYLVQAFTQPQMLIDGVWSLYAAHVVSILAVIIIQFFFIFTVYEFLPPNRNLLRINLVIVLTVLAFLQLGYGFYMVIEAFKIWILPRIADITRPAILPLYVARAVADTITAVVLCVSLYNSRVVSGKRLKLVKVPILFGINGFMLTTILAIVQMCLLTSNNPRNLYAVTIEWVSVQLYINSLMATLNARWSLKDDAQYEDNEPAKLKSRSLHRSAIFTNLDPNSPALLKRSSSPLVGHGKGNGSLGEIAIGKETIVMSDMTGLA